MLRVVTIVSFWCLFNTDKRADEIVTKTDNRLFLHLAINKKLFAINPLTVRIITSYNNERF
jgi:hypothetical protein